MSSREGTQGVSERLAMRYLSQPNALGKCGGEARGPKGLHTLSRHSRLAADWETRYSLAEQN
jgi:hypothetical protein